MQEVKRRVGKLVKALRDFLVMEDAFGLEQTQPAQWKHLVAQMVRDRFVKNRRRYAFLTDPEKLKQFQTWLKGQMDEGLLELVGGDANRPWTAAYVESAWRKGMMRAYTDVRKEELSKSPEWYRGTKEQFVLSAFRQPEMFSKVQLLGMRAFEGMKGVTEQMSTQMSRILADGMVNGYSPQKIARTMTESIGTISRQRALTIARTEIIHAHAEGQLDGYSMLGVDMVDAEVEWSTARDALVCATCAGMEKRVYTIKEARGLIPLHPNCRCAWRPHVKKKGRG